MDTARFAALLRSLPPTASRRGTLRLLAGSALGGLFSRGSLPSAARRRKRRKKRKKRRNTCTPFLAECAPEATCCASPAGRPTICDFYGHTMPPCPVGGGVRRCCLPDDTPCTESCHCCGDVCDQGRCVSI